MKKIITKFKFNVLIIVFSVLVIGCQKEEEPITTQVTLLEQMQQTFNPNDFNETISYDYEVDWNNGSKQYSKELETSFYEFPLNYISPLNPEALNKQREEGYYIHYKLIATIDDNDAFKFYMAKFYQEIDDNTRNSSYSISINIDNGYKGVTHMFNIENDMVFAKRIEEDRIKNNPILLKKEFSDNNMASRVIDECVTVTTEHYKDWYKVYTIDGVTYTIYSGYSQYLGSTTEEVCDSYWLPDLNINGGGGAGTYNKNSPSSVYDDCSGSECKYQIDDGDLPFVVFNPDNPIQDVQEFLKCFNTSQSATLTVYVLEPNPGSGDTNYGKSVGHTYVSISQGSNTSTYGFYPVEDDVYPFFNEQSSSVLGNDGSGNGDEHFTASISTTISGSQLQQIINSSVNFNSTYHLDNYNCTDFAIEIGNLGGLNLPEANGSWIGGGGSNPGTLGQYLRNLPPNNNTTVNTNNGNGVPNLTNQGC